VGAFTYVSGTDRVASQRVPDLAGPQAYAYGYDQAGSVSAIAKKDASGTAQVAAVCLRHDLLGRLVLAGTTSTVVSPGGTACTSDGEVTAALGRYKYDSRNRRVARQVGGQWTYVVSDGSGSPLSELALVDGSWTKVRDYVWLDGQLLAQVEYAGTQVHEYFAHLDHLGTPRGLTNPSGQVVWSSYQRPYGEVLERTVVDPLSGRTVVTNVRLPGQYDERLLGSLGLQGPYYNWNRWYLSSVGRYLELDPIALRGGFNGEHVPDWYNYASENPLTNTDPNGRGTTYRDKWYCAQEYGCPISVDCGGTSLNLVSCGSGSCQGCPGGGGNLAVRYWCAYESSGKTCPKKTATLFKPALGDLVGLVKVCWE
jgi:RHS repeat-associated protein